MSFEKQQHSAASSGHTMYTIGDHVQYHVRPNEPRKGVIKDIAIQSAFKGQTKPGHPERWTQEHHRFLVEDDRTGEQKTLKVDALDKKL
ncbi:hypothetical protein IWQ62_001314 [Dispira parvispora]|uniref:Uncharacterized protein n=1 Tax=Dispira parvispora TaxID=1520584 RepID=A0A9W8AZB2_9FUNG|nr:hypothetical protein IWQ62_001314 [Dispira parvispora]